MQPFFIWMSFGKLFFQFPVVVDTPFFRVYEQYLTRLQAALLRNFIGFKVYNSHLTGHNHHTFRSDSIATWTQAITVKHSSCIAAITEEESGRTIPRFHQNGMILVERFQFITDGILVIETLWHQYSHGLRQGKPTHDEELEYIVQTCRITHTRLYDRADFTNTSQCLTIKHALTRLHPRTVAPDGVNLSVMRQHAERLGQAPCWKGVGTETRMYQS